jgi:hypothetical protein
MDLSLKRKITHLAYLDLIRLYATGKEESIKAAEVSQNHFYNLSFLEDYRTRFVGYK